MNVGPCLLRAWFWTHCLDIVGTNDVKRKSFEARQLG